MNLMELFTMGGVVMWPLLIFSLTIWTILIERLWFLHKFHNTYQSLNRQAQSLWKENKIDELKGLLRNAPDFIATPYMTLVENFERPFPDLTERWQRRLLEIYQTLRRHLWILATVAAVAPFLGLFGTVIGIIRSFDDMAKAGKGGFSVVAAGLSEALISTAAGILVAVIAVLLYNFLAHKVQRLNLEFKNQFADLAALCRAEKI